MRYGHIKLSRKLFDGDPWWGEKREFSRFEAWVDMLQLAAWRPASIEYRGEQIQIRRGEFILSIRHAARRWGWTPKKTRGVLSRAQDRARIRAQRETSAGTVYLIVNYDTYQAYDTPDETPMGTPKGTAGAQLGHSEGTGRAQEESSSSRSLPEQRFLSALPANQRASWAATLDAWRSGMGYPNGRAADDADIDVGLTEYLASERDPSFSAVHVKAFVVKAERSRLAAEKPTNGPYFTPAEVAAAYE